MKSMNVILGGGIDIRLALNTHQVASTTEARGLALEVMRGSVWITFEGWQEDLVLNPGERLPINRRGRMVIQGLADSELRFLNQPQAAPASAHPTPGIRSQQSACSGSGYSVDCWRNLVGGMSGGRLNIDMPI